MSDSLRPLGLQAARFLCPWDFPGKNTGVGFHFLLQRLFLPQGLNLPLLLWQADSLPLSLLRSHTNNCVVSILSSLCHSDHISAPYLLFSFFFSISFLPLAKIIGENLTYHILVVCGRYGGVCAYLCLFF